MPAQVVMHLARKGFKHIAEAGREAGAVDPDCRYHLRRHAMVHHGGDDAAHGTMCGDILGGAF